MLNTAKQAIVIVIEENTYKHLLTYLLHGA
jgi:hypothetical protein